MKEMDDKEKREMMDKQYQRLIKARNFHYENLNRWLMTFYVILGALFVAFYTIHTKEATLKVEIIVALVGYIVSIAAYLSGKGYYYWETNWIMLVHHFEKTYFKEIIEEYGDDMRVYSVFANKNANENISSIKEGANISTSKVALAVTAFIAWLWGTIVIYLGINLLPAPYSEYDIWIKIIFSLPLSIVLTQCLVRLGGVAFPSYMKSLDDLCITQNNEDKPIKLPKQQ